MGKGIHIGDEAMPWSKRTHYIPWSSFDSVTNLAVNDTTDYVAGAITGSPATAGGPLSVEIGATSTDLFGISVAAAGDLFSAYWPFPSEMDLSGGPDVEVRVHFVHQATAADAPIFKLHHLDRAKQEAFSEPVANKTEVLSLDAHTCSTTADSLEITAWNSFSTQPASGDSAMIFAIEADDLGSASADEIQILGVEFRYNVVFLEDQAPGD